MTEENKDIKSIVSPQRLVHTIAHAIARSRKQLRHKLRVDTSDIDYLWKTLVLEAHLEPMKWREASFLNEDALGDERRKTLETKVIPLMRTLERMYNRMARERRHEYRLVDEKKCIRMYRFEDAPVEYQAFLNTGGDEEWLWIFPDGVNIPYHMTDVDNGFKHKRRGNETVVLQYH